jgi:hypothetical protein
MKIERIGLVFLSLFVLSFAADTCNVRFINACSSSSAPISLNIGTISIPAINLGTISGYVSVGVGKVTLSVTGPDGKLINLNVDLESGGFYTVALVGDVSLSLKIFVDSVAVNVDVSVLRVVLLGQLEVDLNLYLDVNVLGLLKATADVSSSISFQKITSGNVTLFVKNLLGLNIAAQVLVALPGKAYTCYLIPSTSSNSILDVVLAADVSLTVDATVNIRLLHGLVPLLGKLDLVVNGKVVLSGCSYGAILAYVSVNAGIVDIQVRIAGTLTVLLELKGVKLIAGNSYTLCVFGESKPFVKLLLDTVLVDPTNLLVRVVHLAESLLLPQVVSIEGHPLLSLIPNPLKFQDVSNFISINLLSPLKLTIAASLDLVLANINLNVNLGDASTVCILGSKYSSTRPLELKALVTAPLNFFLDTSLAQVQVDLNLLGLKIYANVLGLLGLNLNL